MENRKEKVQRSDTADEASKEKQKAEAAAGVRELGIETLESVSGGNQSIPPEWVMKDE